jgi:hypothetical protein
MAEISKRFVRSMRTELGQRIVAGTIVYSAKIRLNNRYCGALDVWGGRVAYVSFYLFSI